MNSPVHCLLVDDLPANLLSLEALLRREGLVLLKASTGEEALELLLRHEVALALIDVQMPGMDGFQLAEFMRGNERTRRVPIIFVTAGSADSQRRFRGYEAGAVDFIHKPIEPDVLRSKAEVFFDLYRQRLEIAEQRDKLATAAEALREADRQKDRFLAVLGHELRNPIASLLGGLHLLKRRPEKVEELQSRMEGTLFHLSRLVDDLLDVARISEGKVTLRTERIEVRTVLQSAVDGIRHQVDAAGHRLITDIPEEPIWLEADHTRLAQVVTNLLHNAAKYTPPAGEIRLSVRREGAEAVIEVSDNGVGIPTEQQSQIFAIFGQISEHLSHAQGGLGIGLALVKQLVSLHQGSVSVASDGEGCGSTFTVRLPTSSPPPDPEDQERVGTSERAGQPG